MSDWQPIETAPKDGTVIFLKCGDAKIDLGIVEASWRAAAHDAPWMRPYSYEECNGHKLRWRTPDGRHDVAPGRDPKWKPLNRNQPMTTTDPKLIEPVATVREIETVTGDFLNEPGQPFYRIEINGYCADFDYREAAENFAAAINEAAHQWQPIETAPYNMPVRIKAGEMTFLARLLPNASMTEDEEDCDQWQAEIEGEHPPCWSGGGCWSSNENESASLQPTHWQPLPSPPAIEAHKEPGQ